MGYRQKLAYIVLGVILVLIGILISHVLSQDVTAQEEKRFGRVGETFGTVVKDSPANILTSEYLHLFFNVQLSRAHIISNHRSGFQLLSPFVWFNYSGQVSDGVVYVMCVYDYDAFTQVALKGAIRDVGKELVNTFRFTSQWPHVRKRWSPPHLLSRLVVRHVDNETFDKTLAVTLNGTTHFDRATFYNAEWVVENSNGLWDGLK